jgi:hypothetical protein
MSIEKLTAYATIGAEHQKIQDARNEKMKRIMETLSDDEFDQLMEFSKQMGDERMVRDLPVWRAMVKKG